MGPQPSAGYGAHSINTRTQPSAGHGSKVSSAKAQPSAGQGSKPSGTKTQPSAGHGSKNSNTGAQPSAGGPRLERREGNVGQQVDNRVSGRTATNGAKSFTGGEDVQASIEAQEWAQFKVVVMIYEINKKIRVIRHGTKNHRYQLRDMSLSIWALRFAELIEHSHSAVNLNEPFIFCHYFRSMTNDVRLDHSKMIDFEIARRKLFNYTIKQVNMIVATLSDIENFRRKCQLRQETMYPKSVELQRRI